MTAITRTRRRFLVRISAALAGAALALGAGGAAAQAAVGTFYAGGVTAPQGTVNIGGTNWVADHLQGLCRLDPVAGTTQVAINVATCSLIAKAPGQVVFDAARNLVYTPDLSAKSVGVVRYTYNPVSRTLTTPAVVGASLAVNKPDGLALDAAGNLYVSNLKNGAINKITAPFGAATVSQVAQSSDNKRVLKIAFVGTTLFLAEGVTVTSIPAATLCTANTPCIALNAGTGVFTPTSLTSNRTTTLYIGTASSVSSFVPATGVTTSLATTATLANGTVAGLQNVSGLGLDSNGTTLVVGDDPTGGGSPIQGRLFRV